MRLFLIFSVVLLATTTVAQDFTSAPAKQAQSEYEAELQRLEGLYEKALGDAKTRYVEKLESARKTALIANNLDEAQRIIEEKKALEGPSKLMSKKPQPKRTAKPQQHWLVGTEWSEGLHPKGQHIRRWTQDAIECYVGGKPQGRVQWRMIDNNTAIATNEKNLFIWVFDGNQRVGEVMKYNQTARYPTRRIK